ncbi:uncharacterized protein Anr2p [[Candida] jaroonii]|uniref:Uncharacterized protein Anr2p n=1 Tax=[Candida] jaroonii TaxID=467808 RepID=A0ACA9YAZ3_9ASCO|nr:uncharacterized protein Anr2p [[Candida] jaroonii]
MSEIVSIFLVQFDVKVGYKIVWSKSTIDISLDGIEFKCLPSGIEEFSEDLIPFTHFHNDEIYYGVSKFRQNMKTDRDQIKMFSVGVLCKPKNNSWMPNSFISNGFQYVPCLDDLLSDYINGNDRLTVPEFKFEDIRPRKFVSPLLSLPSFLNRFGPLIFRIFKLSLLRKNIIIVNKSKRDNYELAIFTYLISIISLIPSMKIDVKQPHYSQPLYNISLNDIEKLPPHYIAVTNDEIILNQPVYDIAIIIDETPKIMTYESIRSGKNIISKATYNDYLKFKVIYEELKDDAASIANSSSSINLSQVNNTRWGYETSWWDNVTPVSWTQYIWSAFSWFASAGQMNDDVVDRVVTREDTVPSIEHPVINHRGSFNSQLSQLTMFEGDVLEFVEIVGFFHKLTKKWIYLINEIVMDELYHGEVEINYSDLVDLELDPYSEGDIEFLKEFVMNYWDVDSVEISSGLKFFC